MGATVRPGPSAGFDELSVGEATAALRPVCASDRWIAAVLAGRPYGSAEALGTAADAALADLDWADVEQALAAHPRIGDRAGGDGPEAVWSRREQAAAAGADPAVADQLRAANVAYEECFGWVFLICASGRGAAEILLALRERLGHDPDAERAVVRSELREIVRLRLRAGLDGAFGAAPAPDPTPGASLSTHVLDAVTGRPAVGMDVRLDHRTGTDWTGSAARVTDGDGRVADLAGALTPGVYRLVFDTGGWAGGASFYPEVAVFYPEVAVTFRVEPGAGHLHVPLLLSPFAYSTYRGS